MTALFWHGAEMSQVFANFCAKFDEERAVLGGQIATVYNSNHKMQVNT